MSAAPPSLVVDARRQLLINALMKSILPSERAHVVQRCSSTLHITIKLLTGETLDVNLPRDATYTLNLFSCAARFDQHSRLQHSRPKD